jgi:hypothetical protein
MRTGPTREILPRRVPLEAPPAHTTRRGCALSHEATNARTSSDGSFGDATPPPRHRWAAARTVAGAARESSAALRLAGPTRPDDKRLRLQALRRIDYECSAGHRSGFTVNVRSVAPVAVIESVARTTPASGVSATGWMTHAASSSLHRTANNFMEDPMSAQLTHLRAQHHVADLQRKADVAAGAGCNPGPTARSTPGRVTEHVNEGMG